MKRSINFDFIADIPLRGIRRASVFLGLGVNAARNPDFKEYQLENISLFRVMEDDLPDSTIVKFKENFEEWIISCALRELTETFSVFLDYVHTACLQMSTNKGAVAAEDAKIWGPAFEKKGLDKKLSVLRRRFSIKTEREHYFFGIKQARNCLAHRRGVVGMEDVDEEDEILKLQWWRMELLVRTKSGEEISMMPPIPNGGILVEEDGNLCVRFSRNERCFNVGDVLRFTPNDLSEICLLFKLSSSELLKELIDYTRSIGIEIEETGKK